MPEWWSYGLSDFLMFSPATYWRLVDRYHREAWPLHLLALGLGAAIVWMTATRRPWADRVTALVLAAAWLWVGWAFYGRLYAPINWAADYFALAAFVQALLMLAVATMLVTPEAREPRPGWRRAGLVVAVCGLALYPVVTGLAGGAWSRAEVFGLMPEPTALVTLGLLMATAPRYRAGLAVIPAGLLLAGWLTAWTMLQSQG